ncbi:hypothetical protein [Candidatus Solincola sp.]|jgi:hypothetical protein|nr:hypothetical protein [Actinomycetota bacterium]MDI7252940.1 hypothetical protein [Actinomycetota bacterium]
MVALAETGPHPEMVPDIFPWEVFGELEERYEKTRRKYKRREARKKGGLRRKRGRPPPCARKFLEVEEYELSQCESEEPGPGGMPAHPFLSLLRCFLLFSPSSTSAREAWNISRGS